MRNARITGAVLAMLLSACSSPEKDCRDGIAHMQLRTQDATGAGAEGAAQLAESRDRIRTAREQLRQGDYAGCMASLGDAGALLNRSQRD